MQNHMKGIPFLFRSMFNKHLKIRFSFYSLFAWCRKHSLTFFLNKKLFFFLWIYIVLCTPTTKFSHSSHHTESSHTQQKKAKKNAQPLPISEFILKTKRNVTTENHTESEFHTPRFIFFAFANIAHIVSSFTRRCLFIKTHTTSFVCGLCVPCLRYVRAAGCIHMNISIGARIHRCSRVRFSRWQRDSRQQ